MRLVPLRPAAAPAATQQGVGREQDTGQAYGPMTDRADLPTFEERGREDQHQFRLIVSPEEAEQLDDLRTYTRHLRAAQC